MQLQYQIYHLFQLTILDYFLELIIALRLELGVFYLLHYFIGRAKDALEDEVDEFLSFSEIFQLVVEGIA